MYLIFLIVYELFFFRVLNRSGRYIQRIFQFYLVRKVSVEVFSVNNDFLLGFYIVGYNSVILGDYLFLIFGNYFLLFMFFFLNDMNGMDNVK